VKQRASSVVQRKRRPIFESLEEALLSHQQGRLEEAAQHYEAVLEADDRHFGAVHGLGPFRLQQGRFADSAAQSRSTGIPPRQTTILPSLSRAMAGLTSRSYELPDPVPCVINSLAPRLNRISRSQND
jgi:hypothetical protein